MADSRTQPHLGHLLPPGKLRTLVSSWLSEDVPSLDGGGYVVGETPARADLLLKSPAVLAGRPFVDAVFKELECSVIWEPSASDGAKFVLGRGEKIRIATVTGPARLVLLGERVALNAFAECSAIASAARRASEVAEELGWEGSVAGTRKTTPGFRLVQKYGMVVGGMDTHRMDLSSMVMLKDNHIAVAGSIQHAVQKARDAVGFSVKIDVECRSVEEAKEAAGAGADVVMLDNFAPGTFKEAAVEVKREFPHVQVEGSGGITLETIKDYMLPQADVLSFSVNRYVQPVDMSLKIRMET